MWLYTAVGYIMGLNTACFDFLIESETELEGEMVGMSVLGWLGHKKIGQEKSVKNPCS